MLTSKNFNQHSELNGMLAKALKKKTHPFTNSTLRSFEFEKSMYLFIFYLEKKFDPQLQNIYE